MVQPYIQHICTVLMLASGQAKACRLCLSSSPVLEGAQSSPITYRYCEDSPESPEVEIEM